MNPDLSLLIALIPQFVISAILTGFVFQAITSEKTFIQPKIIKRDAGHKKEDPSIQVKKDQSDLNQYERLKNRSGFQNLLFNQNLKMLSTSTLTASTWILIVYAMLGIDRSSLFMPNYSFEMNFAVYMPLISLFAIAMISSFSTIVRLKNMYRWLGTILALISVIVFFKLPAMKWFFSIYPVNVVIYIFIYFAGLFIVFLCYLFWWKMYPKTVFYISFYSSILTYFMLVSLMILKAIPKF
ncbi:hypothetical protein DMB44_01945 [Thermoplasma sp. Kam2015]|uniref:hypothetical protein n=1 Tax=Thermoplasma sp. Kam2015 TaxID=2094122 RepID=UPI000D81E31D|nr:hypothetical protein [Thermoplasma sp. Kam2015]PYB68671.1 hypothetical protein DMB44_01945 [Thermoplasma sp. Kam2015]